ncbi:hypothetical protein KSD_63020 [Ktedonobacter sp. SOSP1-85]|uniref:hypothetical protein n=1 Tax=Ktedonobacter sp. SOSP1-85 TaxID=2778367 RepID=UPI0019155D1C|nr:hypothetical protein [Ktedonobacter sp. SOSP1-85]GHO78531.1 hypothetical protein KSD_63020 [Ktedonobacter sp. SOSP1-85]
MTQRPLSPEEKLHIVRHLISGEKYLGQLSREYEVSHTVISNWHEASIFEVGNESQ